MIKTKKIAGTEQKTPVKPDIRDATNGLPPGETRKGIKR